MSWLKGGCMEDKRQMVKVSTKLMRLTNENVLEKW